MALTVTFVSGPRRSGKSTIIREMIANLYPVPPHYLRLTAVGSDKKRPICISAPAEDCGVASARWLHFDPHQVFEVLPEVMSRIHREDRQGHVVIEADADPCLSHAYSYNARVFVMPAPRSVRKVFRSSRQAAEVLRVALDDTAAFASEIFGLFSDDDGFDDDGREERPDLTAAQMRGFLDSPLGDELATRIQLQPDYHGLVESDVIVINTAVGGMTPAADVVRDWIGRMMDRLRAHGRRRSDVHCCDPLDPEDPLRHRLFDSLGAICTAPAAWSA